LIPFAILGAACGSYAHGRLSDRLVAGSIAVLLVLTGLLLLF